MPRLRDFPTSIPEAVRIHFTDLQALVFRMFCEDRMTQAEIGKALRPIRTRQAVTRILDRALAKINNDPGRSYVGSLRDGDIDKAVAIA